MAVEAMSRLPIIKLFDNFLKKSITLKPEVYISSCGQLVISYESEPQNYHDFGDTEETFHWEIGDNNHLTIESVSFDEPENNRV